MSRPGKHIRINVVYSDHWVCVGLGGGGLIIKSYHMLLTCVSLDL